MIQLLSLTKGRDILCRLLSLTLIHRLYCSDAVILSITKNSPFTWWLCYQFCFCVSLSFDKSMVSVHLVVFEVCSISRLLLHYLCCRNFLQYSLFCPNLRSETNCSASEAVQCECASRCILFSFSGIELLPA